MIAVLHVLQWVAGFIVLAEALNKLERTAPFAPGLSPHDRVVSGLKALAWALLALGGGGAVTAPFLGDFGIRSQAILHTTPSIAETCVLLGFAVLIVRTRVKEG